MVGLLSGKVALITGGGRGIGKEIALSYAAQGCRVAITRREIDDVARAVVEEIEAAARAAGVVDALVAKVYRGDVTDFEAAHEIVNAVVADFGRLDVLVNNAGITADGLMLRMSEQQWDDVVTTNLKGAFNFTHAVMPVMAKARCGSIINLSSVVGVSGNAGQANYAASKAGLVGLAKSVAKEMGGRGIRCNCIAPGLIRTDMTAALAEAKFNALVETIPMKRAGEASEVAGVAVFLASELSSYVTGQVINCCGGMDC